MKYIIVTGACGGLGSAIVNRLLEAGYCIWAVGRDNSKLEKMFSEYQTIKIYACDLTVEEELQKMIKHIVSTTGPISGLVHCAGTNRFVPLHLIKQMQVEEIFKIHVYSAITLCSLLAKKGNTEAGASIVLFSSIAAHEGSSGNSIYAAAKSSLEGFVKSSANDFADRGIRINAIVPGDVDAGMFHTFLSRLSEEQINMRRSKYPLGFGKCENISNMVEFLISEKSDWITGQSYIIDGGHSAFRI